jgi:2-methylcitrate dehydratase PrpD
MGTDIAKGLAAFTVKTRLSDIPPETIAFTKGLALKTVAGMLVGSAMPVGKKVIQSTADRGHGSEVGVIGSGLKTSLWNAVLNNGIFAHAAELEDDSFLRGTAWDITSFPIYFPLSEKLALSGEALMETCVVGLEVHARTTLFYPQGYLGLTVIPGAMGPAAGVAKALNLNETQTMGALGLALSGVPVAYVSFGTDAHYLETALHCLQALIAAELAQQGLAGNPDIVSYMTNILGVERVDPEKIVHNLGKEWRLHDIWVKKYPCCFHMHRHIDALLDIINEKDISAEQVSSVKVHISHLENICDRPEPKTLGDLQFSFQNSIASILLDRDVNFSHIAEKKISDPRFREMRSKVEIVVHPDWRPRYAMETPARVEVTLKDGKVLFRERAFAVGSPQEPISLERFRSLFTKFVRGLLPEPNITWTADAIMDLEHLAVDDLQELNRVLVYERIRP